MKNAESWALVAIGIVLLNAFRIAPSIARIETPAAGLLANGGLAIIECAGIVCVVIGLVRVFRNRG